MSRRSGPGSRRPPARSTSCSCSTEDKGVAGRVLTPDGKPAAGATVALALAQKNAVLEEGQLRGASDPPARAEKPGDRWRRPTIVKTDAEGRFRCRPSSSRPRCWCVHESGVRELAYDAWQKSPEITLDRLGADRRPRALAGQTGRGRRGHPLDPSRRIRLSRHDRQLREDPDRQGRPLHVRAGAAGPGAALAADQAGRAVEAGFTAIILDGLYQPCRRCRRASRRRR